MTKHLVYTATIICAIGLMAPAYGATPTFTKDIAPILHENCVVYPLSLAERGVIVPIIGD